MILLWLIKAKVNRSVYLEGDHSIPIGILSSIFVNFSVYFLFSAGQDREHERQGESMTDSVNSPADTRGKRRAIVQAAFDLFRENGFYATGVDLIMRRAGVSKRTLYKYFPTKNELIVAVLEYYWQVYREHLDQILDRQDQSSRDKILAIFRDASDWFCDSSFHGCLAVNAMGEFSGKDSAIEQTCAEFKRWEIGVLAGLAQEFDPRTPVELANKLFVLLEGMSSIAQVNHAPFPIDMTRLADELIENHLK